MDQDRSWMYQRLTRGLLTPGFPEKVKEFIQFALDHPTCMSEVHIKCPFSKYACRNKRYRNTDDVELHILKNGFVKDYQVWVFHGEGTVLNPGGQQHAVPENDVEGAEFGSSHRMIHDAAGPKLVFQEDEPPNAEAQKFFDMMRAAG